MTIYLTLEQSLNIYKETIAVSGGGSAGFRSDNEKEQFNATLELVQNDDYYPTIEEKVAYLFFSVCKNHCFIDGNKRIALVLAFQMLSINGYTLACPNFINQMENITLQVAASKIDYELLKDIIKAMIYDEYEKNEELQLRILNAIED